MSVKAILSNKGSELYTITKEAPLRNAIDILNNQNIGVVLVTSPAGELEGILSERDIIRRSLSRESGFRDEPVSQSMTGDVFTVSSEASVDDVMDLMTQSRIRHVPVIDDEKLVGLISIGDVVKRKIAMAEEEAANLRDYISAG
jgi:CBS domain-containing protein